MAVFERRGLVETFLLAFFTFGIYGIYWAVITKRELVKAGGDLPTAFLMIVPFANFYFWYRYAQAYAKIVKHSSNDTDGLIYFLLTFFPLISILIFQDGYNRYS
jgi:hypothetical protein